MSTSVAVATVIGDVVDSREAPDRRALHARLDRGLRASADAQGVVRPFAVTVGDEFQGVFTDVGSALLATLRLRLALDPDVDVRFGIGWGPEQVLDDARTPPLVDGPGWWAARAAIEAAATLQASPSTRATRARYHPAEGFDGAAGAPPAAWVDAVLGLRDAQVANLSERSRRLLAGGLSGATQTLMAKDEGITQSAVSQAFTRDALGALVAAHLSLLP